MRKADSLVLRASSAFHRLLRRSLSISDPTSTTISVTIAAIGASIASADDSGHEQSLDSSEQPDKREVDPVDIEDNSKPMVQSLGEQISFGAVLGFATGYTIRKIGKIVLLLAGTEVVVLQYMAYRQWLVVDWRRLGRDLSPKFDRSAWDGLMSILLYKMPFSAAFSGGLVAGLRVSYKK